jgi:hypothetical protein
VSETPISSLPISSGHTNSKVIQFRHSANDLQSSAGSTTATQGESVNPTFLLTEGTSIGAAAIDMQKLYYALPNTSSAITLALESLSELIREMDEARVENDAMKADQAVQRVQMAMPELFKCRKIGDGFTAIVNSIHFSLVNKKGAPLTKPQFDAIWRSLKLLAAQPALTIEQAAKHVEDLEKEGLVADPAEFTYLAESAEYFEDV